MSDSKFLELSDKDLIWFMESLDAIVDADKRSLTRSQAIYDLAAAEFRRRFNDKVKDI